MGKRRRWLGGTSGGMSKHRKAGTPPSDLHAVAELVNREAEARAARRARRGRMFASVRELMASRRGC